MRKGGKVKVGWKRLLCDDLEDTILLAVRSVVLFLHASMVWRVT